MNIKKELSFSEAIGTIIAVIKLMTRAVLKYYKNKIKKAFARKPKALNKRREKMLEDKIEKLTQSVERLIEAVNAKNKLNNSVPVQTAPDLPAKPTPKAATDREAVIEELKSLGLMADNKQSTPALKRKLTNAKKEAAAPKVVAPAKAAPVEDKQESFDSLFNAPAKEEKLKTEKVNITFDQLKEALIEYMKLHSESEGMQLVFDMGVKKPTELSQDQINELYYDKLGR